MCFLLGSDPSFFVYCCPMYEVIFAQEDRDIAASASRVLLQIVPYLKDLKQPQSTKLLYGDISVADEVEKFAELLGGIANSKTQEVDIPGIIQSLGVFVSGVMQAPSCLEVKANKLLRCTSEQICRLAKSFHCVDSTTQHRREALEELEKIVAKFEQ